MRHLLIGLEEVAVAVAVAGKKRRELNRQDAKDAKRKDKEGKTTEGTEGKRQLAGERDVTAGRKRGCRTRCKIKQNLYRIRFFQGFPRREA